MGIKKNESEQTPLNESKEMNGVKFNEPIVYVGETIKGVAVKGRVYSEMPEELKAWIEKVPQLINFVANAENLAEATKNAERLKHLSADIVKMIEKEKGE